jgi:undecaprenyl-diphosphatase
VSIFQAIILGLIQGITEFFPVSSSAHLNLAKWLMQIQQPQEPLFDLVCHSGTLLALLIFLRKDVLDVLKSVKKMALYFLALIPLIPAYFLLKPFRLAASDPAFLGYALMFTAGLLFVASRQKEVVLAPNVKKETRIFKKKWQSVLCIGVMQTMALIPGISRSGSTIAAARLCGWSWKDAAKFSFLLAIPTILGGEFLEIVKGIETHGVSLGCYTAAFLSSFALGLPCVRLIFWVYEKEKVKPIAWYCMAVGLFAWIAFHG